MEHDATRKVGVTFVESPENEGFFLFLSVLFVFFSRSLGEKKVTSTKKREKGNRGD